MSKAIRAVGVAVLMAGFSASAFAGAVAAKFDSSTCKLEYPKASLMNEEEGTVSTVIVVKADGTVEDAKIEKTSGYTNLDRATIAGLGRCKFRPGTWNGEKVQTRIKFDYTWSLE